MKLPNLIKPLCIENLYLHNRLVMPAIATAKSMQDGSVSKELLKYYDDKSEDGYKSLIIVEHSFVSPEGRASEGQLSVADDRLTAGLGELARLIQSNGSKAVMQISHAGSGTKSQIIASQPVGPSPVDNPRLGGRPRALTTKEVEGLVEAFKKAAIRSKTAGFDGVEIHSAHGYLLNQFYSPLTNKRTDKYGGDIYGRIQIHLEIIKAVRDGVGFGYPILLRLGAADYMEGGTTIEDSLLAVKEFEKAGIDILDISGGFCGYDLSDKKDQAYFSSLTEKIKKEVTVPVILTGGVTSAALADTLIRQGKADLIGVGRAIVRESDWAKKELSLYQKNIRCFANEKARDPGYAKMDVSKFASKIEEIRNFHRRFTEYKSTPLKSLGRLSESLKVDGIWIKDESHRFGLNAFKVLGGSYAIGKYLAKELCMDINELSFEILKSEDVRAKLGELTFVTATDGNHGRGVAWASNKLGQKSVVFMPKGSAPARLKNIQNEGAQAFITDLNYDDTVRYAKEYAQTHKGVIIQDSVREGYEEIPTWIMLGYTTIMDEILEQLKEEGAEPPTHIFLQAGVGAFPGGIAAYLAGELGGERPIITIVEPDEADCFYRSMKANENKPLAVKGFMPTIMAGLACGEPCSLAWDILKDYGDFFVSCSDRVAVEGMKTLANPIGDDEMVVSGESGAVGLGLVKTILIDNRFQDIRKQLKLNGQSRIVLISTEGDTDPENYTKIVGN